MAAETTIRVERTTGDALKRIAADRGVTTAALVEAMTERESELTELAEWMDDFTAMSHAEVEEYRQDFAEWQARI
jgi:deferrochelatase/peroxidase EfeB